MGTKSPSYIQHLAVTVLAAIALAAHRFVSNDGNYASAVGGAGRDMLGVSETDATVGESLSVVVSHSYPVEAAAVIAQWSYVKPDADGRAVVGSLADHCGVAMTAAQVGELVEVRLVAHRHA